MGVVVDFGACFDAMLDELQETYDGRIRSPQGKVIRILPVEVRKEENGTWMFHGHVYVSTMMGEEIYQAKVETVPVVGVPGLEEKLLEARNDLERLAAETEQAIAARGFMTRRGRYIFEGERPHLAE